VTAPDEPDEPTTRGRLPEATVEALRRRTSGPFASRRRRLLLAYGYVVAAAAASGAALGLRGRPAAAVQFLALVAMVWLWFLLRRATRLVVDAPDRGVDELLIRLRDRVFVLAYQLLAVVVVGIAALLFVTSAGGISEPLAIALAWAAFGSAFGLPIVVAAVALPDS
jgi:hypothetical protein